MSVAHLKTNMGDTMISTHRKDLCNLHNIAFSAFTKHRPRRYVLTCWLRPPAQESSTKPHYPPLFFGKRPRNPERLLYAKE